MIVKSPTHLRWLDQNFSSVNDYLYKWVDEWSRGGLWSDPVQVATPGTVRYEFLTNPSLGRSVVQDWINNSTTPTTNQSRLTETVRKEETYVILLTGMGGSGKGSTTWWLADQFRDEYNIKVVMPVMSDAEALPEWATPIPSIMDMAYGDLVLYDEAGIRASSRHSMSKENENATAWLPVGRHSGAKVIYITQFSAIADKNISRFTNIHISKGFSSSAFGQDDMERAIIADNPIYEYFGEAQQSPGYAGVQSHPKDWSVVMAGSGSGSYLAYTPMPDFYNEKLSKPFRKYIDKAGGDKKLADELAMTDAQVMLEDGHKAATIEMELRIRGFRRSLAFWRIFTGEDKVGKGKYDDLD